MICLQYGLAVDVSVRGFTKGMTARASMALRVGAGSFHGHSFYGCIACYGGRAFGGTRAREVFIFWIVCPCLEFCLSAVT